MQSSHQHHGVTKSPKAREGMRFTRIWQTVVISLVLAVFTCFAATNIMMNGVSIIPRSSDDAPIHQPSRNTPQSESALPLISVIIPFKNYEKLSLIQAIESASAQTYPNVEVIVVDVSGDERRTRELDDIFQHDDRVSIHHTYQPNGTFAGYARNLGAYNFSSRSTPAATNFTSWSDGATKELVAFLDADDAWLPLKLELQYKFATLYNVLDFSFTESFAARKCRYDDSNSLFTPWNITDLDPYHVNKMKNVLGAKKTVKQEDFPLYNGEMYSYSLGNKFGEGDNLIDGTTIPATITLEYLMRHNMVITSTVMMSRALFEEVGGFNNTIHRTEDIDLWRRALQTALKRNEQERKDIYNPKIGYFNVPLAIYDFRCHGKDGTTNTA